MAKVLQAMLVIAVVGVLAFVGGVRAEKDEKIAIRAFRKLTEDDRRTWCVCVGQAKFEENNTLANGMEIGRCGVADMRNNENANAVYNYFGKLNGTTWSSVIKGWCHSDANGNSVNPEVKTTTTTTVATTTLPIMMPSTVTPTVTPTPKATETTTTILPTIVETTQGTAVSPTMSAITPTTPTTPASNDTASTDIIRNTTVEPPQVVEEGGSSWWIWTVALLCVVLLVAAIAGFYIRRYAKKAGFRQAGKLNGQPGNESA